MHLFIGLLPMFPYCIVEEFVFLSFLPFVVKGWYFFSWRLVLKTHGDIRCGA